MFLYVCIAQLLFVTTIVFNTNVSYDGMAYPVWAILTGWWIAVASMLCIPLYAIYKLSIMDGPFAMRWRTAIRTRCIRPANEPHRSDYERMLLLEMEKRQQRKKLAMQSVKEDVWRSTGHFSEHML